MIGRGIDGGHGDEPARAVDRFDGESDDERTGKGRASGSSSAASHRSLTLVPPERSRHGHLRPRVLSWRNGRIRLVQRCLAGLQVHRSGSTSPFFCSTSFTRNTTVRSSYFAASPDGVLAPFPDLATADGDFLARRPSGTCWATCGSSGSSAARWSRCTAAAISWPFTCARPIFSTLAWV